MTEAIELGDQARGGLGPVRADGEKDRVQEQRRQADVLEVAALELLRALPELCADARTWSSLTAFPARPARTATRRRASTGRARTRRSPCLERLGAQQRRPPRKQSGDERLGGLADLRHLNLKLALMHLDSPAPRTGGDSRCARARLGLVTARARGGRSRHCSLCLQAAATVPPGQCAELHSDSRRFCLRSVT